MANKNPYLKDRDILDQALEHSWGKTADAKAKEKAYNREYYQRHKEEILRRARQAGEGIQRTAQNAYNTARREARGIRDAVNPQPRQYSNPNGWTRSEHEVFNRVDSYDANRRALDDARKYRNLAKNTPGAAETERRYRNAMRARSQNAAAVNEALKDSRQLAPDSRFDSKLVRDAQIAYSKARGTARKAKDAVDRYVDDTLDYAKKLNKDARTGINDAYNRAKSGIEDVYSQASRKTKNVKNDLETSKRLRQMKNADALLKAINRLPSDKYEETQELTRKLRSANAQAYNQASKSRRKKRS